MAKAGYRVSLVATGREALEQLKGQPDLVLLDPRMPDMDGLEVLKKLRRAKPGRPVIMLAAAADLDSRIDAFKAGADDVVPTSRRVNILRSP